MKKVFELVIPVAYWETKEILESCTTFQKRSKIEDVYYASVSGDLARLRRQDTICRLSCTKPLKGLFLETIVLDFRSCQKLLTSLGFREVERIAVTRDIFRHQHYSIYLDKAENIGEFLVIEAEAGHKKRFIHEKAAKRLIRSLEIPWEPEEQPHRTAIDMTGRLPYTKAINSSF